MWGALIFLLFFLVIDPKTRDAIIAIVEQARLRLAVEAPLPYFLLVIVGGSALVSFLIMAYWPRVEEKARPVQVIRRYQGQAEADLARMPATPAFGLHQILELACLLLPVRARAGCTRVLRHAGFGGLKRLPGA
jgi:hypothetical protein